jgi:hypothetical protein
LDIYRHNINVSKFRLFESAVLGSQLPHLRTVTVGVSQGPSWWPPQKGRGEAGDVQRVMAALPQLRARNVLSVVFPD